ncbi:MAG: condensation domain-containing protein [Opitutales bacterium]
MLDPTRIAALRKRVASLSAAQRRLLRQRLEGQGIEWSLIVPDEAETGSEASAQRPAQLPLSASQAHVWALHQLHPSLTAYHIPLAWSLRGPLDRGALDRALHAVGARHEALRTVFRRDARGLPYQLVLDAPSPTARYEDFIDDISRTVPVIRVSWGAPAKAGEELWMKEPYGEGLASYSGPESCVVTREGGGEALTGARAGWVLSRETTGKGRGADVVPGNGRQHRSHRHREMRLDPAWSETPCMYGNSSHATVPANVAIGSSTKLGADLEAEPVLAKVEEYGAAENDVG